MTCEHGYYCVLSNIFDEADELLADMEQHLLELDPEEPDIEQLNAIFRAAHSIKGGAGTFGFNILQETTHCWKTYSMVHVVMKCD